MSQVCKRSQVSCDKLLLGAQGRLRMVEGVVFGLQQAYQEVAEVEHARL